MSVLGPPRTDREEIGVVNRTFVHDTRLATGTPAATTRMF
jgi:hypothetical protein